MRFRMGSTIHANDYVVKGCDFKNNCASITYRFTTCGQEAISPAEEEMPIYVKRQVVPAPAQKTWTEFMN